MINSKTKKLNKIIKLLINDLLTNDFKKIYFSSIGILKSKLFGQPRGILIEPTNYCNLKCSVCWAHLGDMKRKKGYMSFKDFKKIIDDIKGFIWKLDIHNFGEPLMNKDIFKMIKYANSKGLRTEIATNITLLNKEKIKKLLESKLDIITLSFGSPTKQGYESIRVPAKFENTFANLKLFCEMKNNSNKIKPYTKLQMILTKKTEKEKEEFVKLAKSLKINEINIKTLGINTNWPKNKLKKLWKNMAPKNEETRYKWTKGILSLKRPTQTCLRSDTSVILWNGTVCPCCRDYNGDVNFGNAIEENFRTIWNSEKYKNMRKTKIKNKELPFCKKCS